MNFLGCFMIGQFLFLYSLFCAIKTTSDVKTNFAIRLFFFSNNSVLPFVFVPVVDVEFNS
jgi:hypothetical protein